MNVGGDLGGDMVAAQPAQRGLDGGGQRGLALGIDGGAAERGNLGDICGAASICMQPPTKRARTCRQAQDRAGSPRRCGSNRPSRA